MTAIEVRRRFGGAISALSFGFLADATSLLPPKWRYAYVHPITRKLLPRQLAALSAAPRPTSVSTSTAPPADIVCALVADKLDVGGIGAVVEMLALGLGAFGVRPVIVCQGDGPRAQRLRERGLQVISVADGTTDISAIREANADVVQVHSAPPLLEKAAIDSGLPLVAVLHNTEIHYTHQQWRRFGVLYSHSAAAVAVSRVVQEFHRRHLPLSSPNRFTTIANGAPDTIAASIDRRREARTLLSAVVGADLKDAVVFVCLARYDAQKNIAGSVASFLRAVGSTSLPIHLVIAGEPSDWVELRRADGIRRWSRHGGRVHLLGNSNAQTLLDAGDGFLLDSFFEGWPVAATEALEAGLPLVLSDVGGAEELVARDAARSILVPNATGQADAVTDARVGLARWRSTRQSNVEPFAAAIVRVAEQITRDRVAGRVVAPVKNIAGVGAMVEAHAELVRRVARSHD
ncbi:glycosyltransferase [Salinibacterium sp. PAMC 21357]|uniref:glycosyltransferase n=1 Tax=Salinibacterium sp. PAMC 21357 TaxID=1112215 RepID=UPI000289716B|nr:glycosyltransferase [Salinibacterium sp. PAMC 21357]